MAIFIILLIFSVVSTFAFRRSANFFDSALSNLFLSRSLLISFPNSFWTESGIVDNKFRTLSVASLSLFSFAKNASSSLLISSNSMAWFSLCYPTNFEKNSSIGFYIFYNISHYLSSIKNYITVCLIIRPNQKPQNYQSVFYKKQAKIK